MSLLRHCHGNRPRRMACLRRAKPGKAQYGKRRWQPTSPLQTPKATARSQAARRCSTRASIVQKLAQSLILECLTSFTAPPAQLAGIFRIVNVKNVAGLEPASCSLQQEESLYTDSDTSLDGLTNAELYSSPPLAHTPPPPPRAAKVPALELRRHGLVANTPRQLPIPLLKAPAAPHAKSQAAAAAASPNGSYAGPWWIAASASSAASEIVTPCPTLPADPGSCRSSLPSAMQTSEVKQARAAEALMQLSMATPAAPFRDSLLAAIQPEASPSPCMATPTGKLIFICKATTHPGSISSGMQCSQQVTSH